MEESEGWLIKQIKGQQNFRATMEGYVLILSPGFQVQDIYVCPI